MKIIKREFVESIPHVAGELERALNLGESEEEPRRGLVL